MPQAGAAIEHVRRLRLERDVNGVALAQRYNLDGRDDLWIRDGARWVLAPDRLPAIDERTACIVLADFNRRVEADWRRPGIGRGEVVVAKRVDIDAVVAAWHELRRADPA